MILSQVVALYRSHLAVPNVAAVDELRMAFEQVFLGQPLSDPSIPSLVFEGSDGEIVGLSGRWCIGCGSSSGPCVWRAAVRWLSHRKPDNSELAVCYCGSTWPDHRTSP